MSEPREVSIKDEEIRLGQFLKLADMVDSGAEAKPVMQSGQVEGNGQPETRRGRKLVPGDVVSIGTDAAKVATGDAEIDVPW